MNIYTPVETPYWLQPNRINRRGHLTRPRRNPNAPPRPVDYTRPGTR